MMTLLLLLLAAGAGGECVPIDGQIDEVYTVHPNCTMLLTGPGSDPRQAGITELRLELYGQSPFPETMCLATLDWDECDEEGQPWKAYQGESSWAATRVDAEILVVFEPALENAHTYRLNFLRDGVSWASVLFRGLVGDVDGDGQVGAFDRSVVLAVWTAGETTCRTDLNGDGMTDGADRSIVVAAWTGENCAPH